MLRQAQHKSWGILHRQGIRLGGLLQSNTARRPLSARPVCERALTGLRSVRSVCPFSVTVEPVLSEAEGTTLYAASLVSSGDHVPYYYVAEWGRFPFGPAVCPIRQVAVRQVITHDAYVPLSNILSLVTGLGRSLLSASSLSPFHPCTPTLENQSHAVG